MLQRTTIVIVLIAVLVSCQSQDSGADPVTLDYPESPTVDQVDDYHGTAVSDPYRWLEDPDSPQTRAWIEAQNQVTFSLLESIPARDRIRERLQELWNYPRYSPPTTRGGQYFYFKNDGLQNHSVLYRTDRPDAEGTVLLDPNTFSEDGTVSLASYALSEDGSHLAYGISEGGSDWNVWKVRNVATGQDLDERLEWVKFSGAAWTPDGRGFFYARYPAPEPGAELEAVNLHQKLYYHVVGTPQSEDRLVYERPDHPEWGFSPSVTEDGRWLVISAWVGTDRRNRVFVKDLAADGEVRALVAELEAAYDYEGHDGSRLFFRSDKEAPRGRVIAVDVAAAGPPAWTELVPETKHVLGNASVIADRLVLTYMQDVKHRVIVHRLDGSFERALVLPGIGSVASMSGRRRDRQCFFGFTGFALPTTIYRYDFDQDDLGVFRGPEIDFDPSLYETKQVWYTSKDGTEVPMFLVHKKGLVPDGKRPTYLYGYGGFNISLTPSFSVPNLVWLEMGGIYAQPSLRGGGEFGEEWHQAGMKDKKQNVFDDFIAAAEWLIAEGWTQPEKLAIGGGSNGGLLVGAVMNQRPDLWGAAIPSVGVMDMLRFHKFTIGWAWVPEYGSADVAEEFPVLHAYSPLHNLQAGTSYPATMVTTADHDDRVVPAHSFKYAAALQAAQGGTAPTLIRIETRAGHGAGRPVSMIIEEAADRWAFLTHALGM